MKRGCSPARPHTVQPPTHKNKRLEDFPVTKKQQQRKYFANVIQGARLYPHGKLNLAVMSHDPGSRVMKDTCVNGLWNLPP